MIEAGELVKLAKWCKNGPALMQVMKIVDSNHIEAMLLEGTNVGKLLSYVLISNVFKLEDYEEAMRNHYECYGR